MYEIHKVSRNVLSGNEEEYRALKQLADKCGALSVEDYIDLDCYDYPVGEYEKYYLEFEFPDAFSRDLFVMETRKLYPKKD